LRPYWLAASVGFRLSPDIQQRSASLSYELLHPLPPRIDHEDAPVPSNRDIAGKAELTVLISKPAEAGEDAAAEINLCRS
jgi:hypothetical protein